MISNLEKQAVSGSKSVHDLSLEELQTMIQNYQRNKVAVGGIFTLAQLRLEEKRRAPSRFSGSEVVGGIIQLVRNSSDGLTTYGELYDLLSSGLRWKGNATQSEMSRALDRGIYYCAENSLPILTVLVVRQTRKLGPEAVQNIYDECKGIGIQVGVSPEIFIEAELKRCREFVASRVL